MKINPPEKTSLPSKPTPRELLARISTARKKAENARKTAKVAKAEFKQTRKTHKQAKKAAKIARKAIKALTKELALARAAAARKKAARATKRTRTARKTPKTARILEPVVPQNSGATLGPASTPPIAESTDVSVTAAVVPAMTGPVETEH